MKWYPTIMSQSIWASLKFPLRRIFLPWSGWLSSRWFTNYSVISASVVPPTMYWPLATFSLTRLRLLVRHSDGNRPALTRQT